MDEKQKVTESLEAKNTGGFIGIGHNAIKDLEKVEAFNKAVTEEEDSNTGGFIGIGHSAIKDLEKVETK